MSWDDIPDHGPAVARPVDPGRWVVPALALLLGVGSILMSFVISGNFAFGVVYYSWLDDRGGMMGPGWRTTVFGLTSPWPMTLLIGWVAVAGCLGYAGHRLGRARAEPGRRSSLGAMAARFSAWGLAGCGLDALLIVGMLAYRLDRWWFG